MDSFAPVSPYLSFISLSLGVQH
ncbi:hypothetical protein PUN4_520079 [Paraburkholderia unamae]|nr:hypothetical protein PUN4_520079 [Paraburkholderia unamae]